MTAPIVDARRTRVPRVDADRLHGRLIRMLR
jgi:hypothetical protein